MLENDAPKSETVDHNPVSRKPLTGSDVDNIEAISLLFFAYREFVGDADRILAEMEFGRAHHRVLFFVTRKPGMTVAELLEILGITKQSLARVLKELIEADFIHQDSDVTDKRKRLLFATVAGRDLVLQLSELQSRRITAALSGLPDEARDHVHAFLENMIDDEGRDLLLRLKA